MITKKQKEVLIFVTGFVINNDYFPSLSVIKDNLNLSSPSTIHYHLNKLIDSGYIQRDKNSHFKINHNIHSDKLEIPLLGYIAAGQPIEAVEVISETITISREEIKKPDGVYALRVKGDSMIGEGIYDGDIVVIKKQESADNGDTVVAIIDENEATLKKLYKEKNRIRLQPSNPSVLPLFRDNVEIRGVVIKVIRNFKEQKEAENNKTPVKNLEKSINRSAKKSIFKKNNLKINNIYNIDCLELMKEINDNSIDLIFADPPYNLSKSNFKMKFTRSGGKDLNTNKGEWDCLNESDFESFTRKWLSESFRILKRGGALWVAGTYHNIYLTGYLMQKIGYEILNEVLWHKTDATPNLSCTRFVADHENFIWARKDKKNTFNYNDMKIMNGGKQMRSIWPKGKTAGGKKVHPTQKPEWLLERIVLATSKPKDVVFDPFMGSGTTAIVSKKHKRNYLGAELDKSFYKMSLDRLNLASI